MQLVFTGMKTLIFQDAFMVVGEDSVRRNTLIEVCITNSYSIKHNNHGKNLKKLTIIVLLQDSEAFELLDNLINNTRRLGDIRQLSPDAQTSALEAYHSVVNHFAPKMFHFHHASQRSRLVNLANIANTTVCFYNLVIIYDNCC